MLIAFSLRDSYDRRVRTLPLAAVICCCSVIGLEVSRAAPQQDAQSPVSLAYFEEDVRTVVQLYQQLTGFKIVQDNFVQGKVTLRIDQPVSRAEAVSLIEMTLMNNGYSLVEAEKGVVQIVGTGKNPRTVGLPIISDPKDVPQSERVISYFFKLRHLDPTLVQQTFGQYLSPPQPYTSFLALPDARGILVTERTSVIRKLIELITRIDAPSEAPTPRAAPEKSP